MELDDNQAIDALTVLVQLAQLERESEGLIRRTIMADPERMLGPAVQVAMATGAPMPAVLNSILREDDLSLELIRALRRRIPARTLSLRETDALAAEKLLAASDDSRIEDSLLHEYAERLLEIGSTPQALTAAQRAVARAEQRVHYNPLEILSALRVLSACQVAAEQPNEAIATAERAIPLIDQLSRRGVLLPTTAASAYATLGQRYLSAGLNDRALENLYVAAGLCVAHMTKELSDVSGLLPNAAAHRDLRAPDIRSNFVAGARSTTMLVFARSEEAHGVIAEELNEILAVTSMPLANVLRSLGRAEDALDFALQAEAIFRELADEKPHEFAIAHAQALLEVRSCVRSGSNASAESAVVEYLARRLPAAVSLLCMEAACRQDIERLHDLLWALTAAAQGTPLPDQLQTLGELVTNAVDALRRGSLAMALVMLRWAESFAREFVEPSSDGRVALSRILNALAWAEDEAGLETALGTAREAYAMAVDVSGSPGGDEHLLSHQRAVTANGLANRLTNNGRAVEALEAKQRSVEALALAYDRSSAADVYMAGAWLSGLMRLAEEQGTLTDIPAATFSFATEVLAGFTTHPDLGRVLGFLGSVGFLTVTGLARRNDSEATARALDAVASLAQRFPRERAIAVAMVLTPHNAISCHERTHRLDLADAAIEALAAFVAENPENVEARIELATCANHLINTYVDLNLSKAAVTIGTAGAALRSAEYLAVLPSLGEDDPPGYLQWLDQIEVAGTAESATDAEPTDVTPDTSRSL